MDIQTKDGILLRGIPDGTPDEVIKARIQKIRSESGAPQQTQQLGAQSRKEFDTTLTTPEKIALGAEGLANRARGALPIALQMMLPSTETAMPIVSGAATSYRNLLGEDAFPKQGESIVGQMLDPVALAAGGGVAKAVGMGMSKFAPALGKYASGVAQGGAAGAAATGVAGGDIQGGASIGAGIGAVLPPAAKFAAWLGKYPYHLVERFLPGGKEAIAGRALNKAAGSAQSEVVSELRAAEKGVTAGQAAVQAGSPEFSALQRKMAEIRPAEYDAIAQSQENGRRLGLRSIGKDSPHPDAPKPNMALAETSRAKVADRIYGEAYAADDMRVTALLNKSIVAKGGIHQGTPAPIPLDPRLEPLTRNKVIMDTAEQVKVDAPQLGDPINNLRGLDRIKKTIDADLFAIKNKQPTALQNVTESSLNNAKTELLSAVTKLSPKYGTAMKVFGEKSVTMNQMKIGQLLEDALSSTVGVAERGTVFANKIKDAERIIANETGQTRYKKLSELFTPEQMGKVNRVIYEINRDARLEELASKGTPAITKQLGDTSHEIRPPNWLDRGMQIANSIIRRVQGTAGEKSQAEIAKIMQDPKLTAKLMASASKKERNMLIALKGFYNKTPYISAQVAAGTQKQSSEE